MDWTNWTTPNCEAPSDEISCVMRRLISSVISSEPIQTRRTESMLMILASARSCCGVHWAGCGTEAEAVTRGRSGKPLRRNSSKACASGRFSQTAALISSSSLAKGNSNGIVANSASVSADTASGGVIVPLEVETRVHLPSAE